MKRCIVFVLLVLSVCTFAIAGETIDMTNGEEQTLSLSQPEMDEMIKRSLRLVPMDSIVNETFQLRDHAPWSKDNWGLLRTNPGIKAYKPLDDLTFVGIPIFVAGWIAKGEKHAFKQQEKHSLVTHFKTSVDDYMQFFSPALMLGLKVGGLEGRSDWGRLLATSLMSYFFMDWSVTAIKYTSKEMRPPLDIQLHRSWEPPCCIRSMD